MADQESDDTVYSKQPDRHPAPMSFKEMQKDIDESQFRGTAPMQTPFEGKVE